MLHQAWLSQLQQHKAIAVIRAPKMAWGEQMAFAVARGGMQLIEITWNCDRAPELINQLRSQLPTCIIGTGTLFNVEQVREAIACGAEFLFTPYVNAEMITTAVKHNIPIIPGALTPTEIVTAYHQGASCVKVFPVQSVGGTKYIKSLQGPMSHIPLIPTGGISVENAVEFLEAGAIAVGLSSELFPQKSIIEENWTGITEQAKNLMRKLK